MTLRTAVRLWFGAIAGAALVAAAGCEKGSGSSSLGSGHDFGDKDPNVLTAIGDSITAGNWPGLLAAQLGKTVIDRGHPGDETKDGVSVAAAALASDKPGFLLIQYGANDAILSRSVSFSIANLRAIIQAAVAANTIPVVATVTPMYDGHAAFAGNAAALSQAIRTLASEEGAAVADVESAFGSDRSLIGPDGLHPTPAGDQVIASVFAGVLR